MQHKKVANGQMKIITMVADGGDGTLTPTTFANGSTITFNDVGDSVLLVYNTTGGAGLYLMLDVQSHKGWR